MNLLQHREQYQLLNCLFKENIKEESKNFYIFWVYEVQLWTELVVAYSSDRDKRREISMSCGAMKKSGADLRKVIMTAKGMTSSEGLRGIEYQLLNALAVRNVNKFKDVVMRLGGDEFAVLLPGVSENQAEFLIKLVQAEMTLKDMGITASLGAYTDSYQSHKNFVDFFAIADKKMYENKSQKGERR